MKTIIQNDSNISIYLFEDTESVSMQDNSVEVGDPVRMVIADCNNQNCTLVENVDNPDEWTGHKYLYVDGNWNLNPEYTEPELNEDDIP